MTAILGTVAPLGEQAMAVLTDQMLAAEPAYSKLGHQTVASQNITLTACQYLRHRNSQIFEDENIIVCADLRLDDQDTITQQLNLQNGASVAQIIAKAWKTWGSDTPSKFYGEFAIAIWEKSSSTLFLLRDAIGIRPLYYHISSKGLVFSSSLRQVLANPLVDTILDQNALAKFMLTSVNLAADETYYTGVKQVKPGGMIRFSAGKVEEIEYWSIDNLSPITFETQDQYAEHFQKLLLHSVEERLDPREKTAAHISGGLDSTLLALLADEMLEAVGAHKIQGYTWSPNTVEEQADEVEVLHWVDQDRGIPIHYFERSYEGFKPFLENDPTIEGSNQFPDEIATVAHAQKNEIDVILSGWGGDEFVSNRGIGYFYYLAVTNQWRKWFECTKGFENFSNFIAGIKMTMVQHKTCLPNSWMYLPHLMSHKLKYIVYARLGFAKKILLAPIKQIGWPDDKILMRNYIHYGHITERIESWHVLAARAGLEYRYPLLDRHLIEFVFSIPLDVMFRYGERARLMTPLFDQRTPKKISDRPLKSEAVRLKTIMEDYTRFHKEWILDFLKHKDITSGLVNVSGIRHRIERNPKILDVYYNAKVIYKMLRVAELSKE